MFRLRGRRDRLRYRSWRTIEWLRKAVVTIVSMDKSWLAGRTPGVMRLGGEGAG